MADNHSKEIRSYNMAKIRSKENMRENIVRKYLFSKGLRYRKNDKRYPGCPDIVLPKYKTAIFINGCFWHMHDGCSRAVRPTSNTEYWIPKLKKNKERDQRNYDQLAQLGWRVIVVWECELKKGSAETRLAELYKEITGQGEKQEC